MYLQTGEEAAGSSPLVALGTSAHPVELMVSQQPRQTCLACSCQSGQYQNVSEVLMPVENAHSPSSQLPENSVSQPLLQISRPWGRSLELPL